MPVVAKNKRICKKGHTYYKSSDCPTCPICEASKKPQEGLFVGMSAPARRALEHAGITTPKQLSKYSQKDILKLHGMGPASLPVMRKALKKAGLEFKK